MNKKIRSAESKKNTPAIIRIVSLSTACLIFLFLLVLFIVNIKNVFFRDNPSETQNQSTEAGSQTLSVLPDMYADITQTTAFFPMDEMSSDTLINLVSEHDSYIHRLRVVHSYNGKNSSEYFTITRKGGAVRIESDGLLIICDGVEVYKNYGTYNLLEKADNFSYFEDIGVTSIENIREMINDEENYASTIEVSDDQKLIFVTITDLSHNLMMEFEIALESGLVTTERFYHDGIFYRNVITENIVLSAQTTSETFLIPQDIN